MTVTEPHEVRAARYRRHRQWRFAAGAVLTGMSVLLIVLALGYLA